MKKKLLSLLLLLMIVPVACTSSEPTSALNLDDIQTILPTVSPAEVFAYAQLADSTTLNLGQQVYNTNCATCHGINGEGQFPDTPTQPDSTGRIGASPHNGDGHTWHHHDTLLYEVIRNGGVGNADMFYPMPAFGDQLSDEDIEAVLAYIKTFWTEEQRLIQAERTLINQQQNP